MKISSTPNTSVQQVSQPPISKSTPTPSYSVASFFPKNIWTCWSKFYIFVDPLELYLSPEILLNFLWNLYILSLRLEEMFKFLVFRLLENAYMSEKDWI